MPKYNSEKQSRLGLPCFCFFSRPLIYGFSRSAHDQYTNPLARALLMALQVVRTSFGFHLRESMGSSPPSPPPPCVVLILCFISMTFQVRKHNRSARIVAEQLRFNHRVCFKTHHEKSVVIMMGIVLGVFLVCYGMYLRCSFLLLFQPTITSSQCSDKMYKIPVVVLNWAINPLAYAFFKRA